jgi:hypothetical protein
MRDGLFAARGLRIIEGLYRIGYTYILNIGASIGDR